MLSCIFYPQTRAAQFAVIFLLNLTMQVFKFGGASVKDAEAVKNVAYIVKNFGQNKQLLVVVSAMGKTTNHLEAIFQKFLKQEDWKAKLAELYSYHQAICENLFSEKNLIFSTLEYYFLQLESSLLKKVQQEKFDESYDQIVCFGELISTQIVSQYLISQNIENEWIDARNFIKTDTTWREGKVDLDWSEKLVERELIPILREKIIVTQGFLGGTLGNKTTTLGREGSDYSASIFAYCLNAEKVVIWKDVAGVLNADPKKIADTKLYKTLSYREAAEMTFYGANVIHPKTIKPLANKNIPLYVKSFIEPQKDGTCIDGISSPQATPTIILKPNQILLHFAVKDLAFITEENLSKILHTFTQSNAKINMMQSSAVSLSICTDFRAEKIEKIVKDLSEEFEIRQDEEVQVLTILYYQEKNFQDFLGQYEPILEQKTKTYYRAVVRESPSSP
ncbi:MAG: aspartate kinase [Raineya sp.]